MGAGGQGGGEPSGAGRIERDGRARAQLPFPQPRGEGGGEEARPHLEHFSDFFTGGLLLLLGLVVDASRVGRFIDYCCNIFASLFYSTWYDTNLRAISYSRACS